VQFNAPGGKTHPRAESQLSVVQMLLSKHPMGPPFRQFPFEQKSGAPHALPSKQPPLRKVRTQLPVATTQLSPVHELPSSQFTGGGIHSPVDSSQRSCVQGFE